MTALAPIRELVDGRNTLQASLIRPDWTDENGDRCWLERKSIHGVKTRCVRG